MRQFMSIHSQYRSICTCLTDLVDWNLKVELNRLLWTTERHDNQVSARYAKAQNSAFELGVAEVSRYWPGVAEPRYGRVQHFFFIRATGVGEDRAVLMASINLFANLGTDALTGLPLVESRAVSPFIILARHLNHRVIMPVVGVSLSQMTQMSKLKAAIIRADKRMVGVQVPAAIARHMATGDAARLELAELEKEAHEVTSSRLLVLGAACSDVEAILPA